jgi:prepilin-type N-terminal cleavage/methylation domain-containing protein
MDRRAKGFTLLELVITLLLVGLVAGMLAPFYRQAGEMFADTRARTELTAKGRLALERLSRELREAHPGQIQATANSLRFLQLQDLLALTFQGNQPRREYRACTQVSVNKLADSLDWDIDDDGSSDAILVDGVNTVAFSYSPGSTHRSAVVTIALDLSLDGQSVSLFREVHIRNSLGTVSCP